MRTRAYVVLGLVGVGSVVWLYFVGTTLDGVGSFIVCGLLPVLFVGGFLGLGMLLGASRQRQRGVQRPSPHGTPRLLTEFDGLKEVQDLGSFLKRHSEQELASFIEAFPFSELKLDYASVERDFRNCQRMEMMLHLASILLRWRDYSSDPRWQGLLPRSLNTPSLYSKLSSRLLSFLEGQRGTDIAMVLRTRLYDFAMDLIREDKNQEAMICLEISRPSPREDHDFWLCACYHNIGKLEKDADVISRGLRLAEEIMGSDSTPAAVIQKMRQTDLLGKLGAMASELDKDKEERSEETDKGTHLSDVPEKYRGLASAIKQWWRDDAQTWWSTSGQQEAYCDDEGEPVAQGQGYKTGRRLLCERCADERLTKHVDWEQAVRDLDNWFGPGVPRHLKDHADKLWESPKASSTTKFTMRIGSVFDSGGGVMVAGSPEGQPPRVGDSVEIVGTDGIQKARIVDSTSMGGRVAYVLEGVKGGTVKQGDILQG